jgi:putative ABC transport system ATP-binding protein
MSFRFSTTRKEDMSTDETPSASRMLDPHPGGGHERCGRQGPAEPRRSAGRRGDADHGRRAGSGPGLGDPGEGTDAIRVESLSKSYASAAGPVPALRGVSLGFPRGKLTAVMGPSGSGKSTLLQCAAGLDRPSAGRVMLGGTDLGTASARALSRIHRDRIGFVFQSYNLLPMLTAAENIALPLRLAGRRPQRGQVAAVLGQVGLAGLAGRRPAELSGGQQQRVAIARALATGPEVLFADEPTGALDTVSGRQVLGLLRAAADRAGLSVVIVTHDPAVAESADSVVFLVDGQVHGALDRPTVEEISARLSGWER